MVAPSSFSSRAAGAGTDRMRFIQRQLRAGPPYGRADRGKSVRGIPTFIRRYRLRNTSKEARLRHLRNARIRRYLRRSFERRYKRAEAAFPAPIARSPERPQKPHGRKQNGVSVSRVEAVLPQPWRRTLVHVFSLALPWFAARRSARQEGRFRDRS